MPKCNKRKVKRNCLARPRKEYMSQIHDFGSFWCDLEWFGDILEWFGMQNHSVQFLGWTEYPKITTGYYNLSTRLLLVLSLNRLPFFTQSTLLLLGWIYNQLAFFTFLVWDYLLEYLNCRLWYWKEEAIGKYQTSMFPQTNIQVLRVSPFYVWKECQKTKQ